jgi:carbonic anhydrase
MKIVWLFVVMVLTSIFLVGLGYQIGNHSAYQKPIIRDIEQEICTSSHSSPIDVYPGLAIKSEVQDPKYLIPAQNYKINRSTTETYLTPTKESYLNWNSKQYTLQRITFYSSSKHKINSNRLGLEINLEFQDSNSKDQSQLLNISKLYRFGGKNDKFQRLIAEEKSGSIGNVEFNDIAKGGFVVYQGSELSKKCTNPATWIVYTDVEEISPDQSKFFVTNTVSKDNETNLIPRLMIGR